MSDAYDDFLAQVAALRDIEPKLYEPHCPTCTCERGLDRAPLVQAAIETYRAGRGLLDAASVTAEQRASQREMQAQLAARGVEVRETEEIHLTEYQVEQVKSGMRQALAALGDR